MTAANTQGYAYHASNRLQTATGPWGTKTFTYDGVGNRTQEVTTLGGTTTDVYSYPAISNRVSTVVRNGTTTTRTFGYDGAGNIATDNRAGTTTTYTYNKRNRLETSTSGAIAWGYTYKVACPPPAGRPRTTGAAQSEPRWHQPHALRARHLRRHAAACQQVPDRGDQRHGGGHQPRIHLAARAPIVPRVSAWA